MNILYDRRTYSYVPYIRKIELASQKPAIKYELNARVGLSGAYYTTTSTYVRKIYEQISTAGY